MFDWILLVIEIIKLRLEKRSRLRYVRKHANLDTRQGQRLCERLTKDINHAYAGKEKRLIERYEYHQRND